MWYAINWLGALCMILLFQINECIWYGGNYMNSYFKSKEELEESKPDIQTNQNLLQTYRGLFRPIFRHQHSTFIKYPLVQQTDKVDFNYFNKHLSARENKFEHFPHYDFRIGKNHDTYYPNNFLLPNYKVIINPFFSRLSIPSKIGESQNFMNHAGETLPHPRTVECDMKLKGTRESSYGIKKIKPIHKKKKNEIDKLIYPHKAVGGLLLPSKIILDNFSSWKWKNKKEIQTNNLSMSMVYDLLLPKSTARKPFKKTNGCCYTTRKKYIHVYNETSENQYVSTAKKISPALSDVAPTDCLELIKKKPPLNLCIDQEEIINNCYENETAKIDELKANGWDNEIKYDLISTCVSGCGCRTKKQDQMKSFDCFTAPLAITTEVPIIFEFEDYLCECYSGSSNSRNSSPSKRKKFNRSKCKRKKSKIKGIEAEVSTNKFAQRNVEIDGWMDHVYNPSQGDKDHLINTNDDLEKAKYIIISNSEVIDPNSKESFPYDFENNSSFNIDSSTMYKCSTDNSRIKRRTFRCKSKGGRKRKRAFVPLNTYHNYLLRKPSTKFFTSSIASYPQKINYKFRKINKNKKKIFEKKIKNIIHRNLNLDVSTRQVVLMKRKMIGENVDNDENKGHRKREFVGESQSGNASNPCDDFEEILSSTSPRPVLVKTTIVEIGTEKHFHSTFSSTSHSAPHTAKTTVLMPETGKSSFFFTENEKPTIVKNYTEKPTFVMNHTETHIYSTSVKPHSIHSKATEFMSTHKSTHIDVQIVERSTEIIGVEMPAEIGSKFRPDTGNRNPAKMKCEHKYNRDCICSISKVLEEVNNLISKNLDQKILLSKLTKYNCIHYRPLEISYKISPELKPRLISNKHKELIADEKNGPKEIIDETFQELLVRDVPNEESDFYIFPSTNVEIPCFINDDVQLSPNTADSASYVWKQGNNKMITGGRTVEDLNHRGMLQIAQASIADSDNYTCTVNYTNPDTGQTVSDSFVHSVMVVTLPKFALHTLLHYTAKVKCDQETLEMFELYLPQQVEEYICYIEPDRRKICSVEIHNPICHPKNNELQNVDLKSVWKFRSKGMKQNVFTMQENEENIMELSLNFELDIADVTQTMISTANKTRCGPFCQLKITLKVVEILRESFTIVLPHPVRSAAGIIFKPDLNSINLKILIACEGGYKLVQGFCMPCPANTYSEEGSTECSKCHSGTYQPKIGSRTCEKCPHPFRSGCSSLWLSPTVLAVTISVILLIILISTILVYLCKFCIAKCMVPCLWPCTVGLIKKRKRTKQEAIFPKKILKKKIRKLSPRGRKEYTSEPPTPPSEDFTS